jgi:hypothetical protein
MTKILVPMLVLSAGMALLAQSNLPTPASVLGFEPGADYKLANYEQVTSYFQKIDAASDKMMMVPAGKSSQGRTYYFALISSKRNLERIDRYREIARKLAHPEGLTDEQARELAREGKAFVHIDGGLHATEVAGAQQTPLLLYDLLRRSNEPEIAAILDDVVFMLWPTINPDGMSMVADWYMSHVDAANPGAGQPPMPQLYQDYVGHDNNRDAYMLNMVESRVMEHAWRQWEPDIIYVMHQSSAFPTRIWLPPFAEPIATHAPFIPSREVNMIGMAIAQGLDQRGQVGATHMGTGYDAWYPGYIDYLPIFKNIPAFWTETQGNGAAPRTSTINDIPVNMRVPQPLYPSPWLGGTWHLRDAVEYDETAAFSVLEYASKYRESLLYGRYQSGRDQIKKGRSEAPYAYVVTQAQRDPMAPVELLRRLAFSGVRVYQLTESASIVEKKDAAATTYPAGTWIVPTDQEFAALAREVLDVQRYPDVRESPNGPLDQPYDAAGWTLPLQMGVNVSAIGEPIAASVRAKMKLLGPLPDPKLKPAPYNLAASDDLAPFDSVPGAGFDTNPAAAAIVPPAGRITGSGPALALSPAENNTFRAINRAWKSGANVQYVPATGGGRYVISGLAESAQSSLVTSLALTAERTGPAVPGKRPRLGLVGSPTSMDDGWTRWVLEQYGFEYTRVTGADIQAGGLRGKFDVLLFVDDARLTEGGGRGGRGGGAPGGGGAGAAQAGGGVGAGGAPGQAPAASTEDRTKALDEYVKAGGTIVCFNRSSMTIADALHLPVKNAIAGVNRQQFFVGGSVLGITTDPSQRVMAGMSEQAAVFYDSGPVFETQEGFKGSVLARYQTEGSPLRSGYLLGEKYLQGKAAALDVEHGDGHVVMLGFRPQWRGQPFGTFRVIFNAAMYGK